MDAEWWIVSSLTQERDHISIIECDAFPSQWTHVTRGRDAWCMAPEYQQWWLTLQRLWVNLAGPHFLFKMCSWLHLSSGNHGSFIWTSVHHKQSYQTGYDIISVILIKVFWIIYLHISPSPRPQSLQEYVLIYFPRFWGMSHKLIIFLFNNWVVCASPVAMPLIYSWYSRHKSAREFCAV